MVSVDVKKCQGGVAKYYLDATNSLWIDALQIPDVNFPSQDLLVESTTEVCVEQAAAVTIKKARFSTLNA